MQAEWASQLVLVRWQLKRPMYDFKIFFPLLLNVFIEQNIFFLETCFTYPISEQKFTVCYVKIALNSTYVKFAIKRL